jgi:hypothetical protein
MHDLKSDYAFSLYPHPEVLHLRNRPSRLVSFSTRNNALHWGQGLATGLSQLANLQSGYREHP